MYVNVCVGVRGGRGLSVSMLDITNTELEHLKDGFCMAGKEIWLWPMAQTVPYC